MIVVSGAGDKLLVTLSADEPSEVRETIESLMGCRYNPKTNVYFVPVHDFPLLREKIQRLGHSGQREMDDEAWRLIRDYEERLRLNDVIRDGVLNDEIAREIDETLKSAPWQDQRSDVRFCLRHQRAGIFHEMGVGKAQPLDAQVLTPTGWTRMGDIQVGDLVVGRDGRAWPVTGVFPQGEKDIFRVTFRDGSSTECCDDHLWLVETPLRKWRGHPAHVLPLRELRRRLKDAAGNCRYFVPMVQPVEFTDGPLPLDPYLLGALLGDGGLTTGTPTFSTADAEMIERIAARLPPGVSLRKRGKYDYHISTGHHGHANVVTRALRRLGVMGKRSEHKFIPPDYLLSSVATRHAVLQGLLDTDGYADVHVVEYSSSSKTLAEDVLFLVRSLGGKGRISKHHTPRLPSYRICISLPPAFPPFALGRKAARYRPRSKYPPTRAIVAVEPAGTKPCQCIAVASPDHTYVTDDFIVTHNTLILLATFAVLRRRGLARYGLVVCPNTVKATWLRQTAQHTRLTAQEIGNGSAEIARRLQRLQDDRPDLTVTHYEALRDPQVQRALVRMPFDVVIADEVHLIKNIQTDRAQAMFATLAQIRPSVSLVEVEVELPDGTTTTAVMPAGVQPGQEIDFL